MKLLRTLAVLFMTSLLSFAGLADEERHIVFIHGLSDNGGLWDEMKYIMIDTAFVLPENVVTIDYHDNTGKILRGGGGNTPIENVGDIVKAQIEENYRGREMPPRFDFVVHSMGGLVLRSMVATGRISKDQIRKVVTLATPHYGQDCPSLTYQVDQMDYGSVFIWNLANADFVDGGNVLSVVGTGDKVVDYYAAALNGTHVRYVNKSHCASKLGLWESAPAICKCSNGGLDVVCRMVCTFLNSGTVINGDAVMPNNDTGAMLAQVVDGKNKAVSFATAEIIKAVVGSANGSVDFVNQSPDAAFSAGIVAPAREATPSLLHVAKSGGGLKPDKYKFIVNASKDNVFSEFETADEYEVENGRTTVKQIPAENTKPVDFVFLIDSTGSMGSSINSVKNNAKRLIQEKLGGGARNCRVAVADYRDFPVSPYGNSGDYTFKLRCGFTTDATAAINSLSGISANGGGDGPEAVYSAIASCVQGYGAALGGWRKEAVKTIMLMCDAGPHDPEPFTNYTQAKIIKMLNTLEDEEDEEEASVVDEGEHRLYSLKAMSFAAAKAGESGSVGGVSLYPVLTTSSSSLSSTFAPLASETGGKVVNSGNYDSVASAVEKVIEQSIAANGFEYETVSVKENAGSVTIRVYGGNSSMPASVGYQVLSGTAVGGTDYTADGEVHRLSWAEGERSYKTITIPIIADASSTADKFFSVILCDGENMGLGGTSICRIDVLDASSTGSGIPAGKVFIQGVARQPASGGVSGAGLYDVESVATLIATPTEGNVFTSWENGSTTATRTINTAEAWSNAVNGVATYVASFKSLEDLPVPTIRSDSAVVVQVGEEVYWPLEYDSECSAEVSCVGLPAGLKMEQGVVIGVPVKAGEYPVTFNVRNPKGEAEETIEFIVTQLKHISYVIDGIESVLDVYVGDVYGELPVPRDIPTGYVFDGWYTGIGGTGRLVTPATIVEDTDYTLYPKWNLKAISGADNAVVHIKDGEVAPYESMAAVYDGYVVDEGNTSVIGIVQVKVAKGKVNKKTGKFEAKVTATVQLADGTKKISFKGGVADETGAVTGLSAKGHALEVSLGVNGLAGTFDGKYLIDGVRNRFTSKDKTEKSEVDAFVKRLTGAINIVLPDRRGTLSVTIAAKGKAKIAGAVEGNKVSVTGQLLVGEDAAVVPVVVAKKVSVALGLWINKADLSVEIGGLDSDLGVVGWAGKIGAGAKFTLDEIAVGKLMGMLGGLYADYLPKSVDVAPNGKKWVVADGAKAGKLVLLDKATGALNVDKSKFTDNMSGLKLTYKEKGGTFTGTFKVYNFENGKIKSYSANVTGVMIESKGYGTATIKKVGSVEVKIE